ncbi:extracellular solute-binding protein [Arthrobacter sp. TES]|uniref:extracellular solute-binding protein n=1 Tax=Paenarthrobacter ureafaciens TaxID=37931 RepID=UPI0004042CC6|nr:extracellular solute-binding protein [Paenarthrobacter ureafaciens]ERI38407.2 carbohydrate-binding protein [Arthrobacter sp. AK-YN10]QOI64435.1 extracellular solute-binding protein [Arthrobacter sp. TES]GLU59029.1 carbohydrate-binding protein [Paenarthrobacter ureafaciens]GLU63296.1 carbohydrate-binding protein [Paenarthrobacter ureafaciens]GLU67571.1 carbohydrate-binding protein [Paenarthrobacter ureafaciens]
MKQFETIAGRQVSRRQLLAGSAALGSLGLMAGLTGCGGAAQASQAREIGFWHLLSGGDGIKMQAMIATANQANPGFKVHPTVLAWGPPYYTKLAMASAGGRPPELAIMHASRVPGYAPGGLIEPWDLDLLAENGVRAEDFASRIWEKSQQDGKVFSIALDSHPFIMFYNTDVAGKAGLLEAGGRLKEVSTPDDFKAMALEMKKVTKGHGLSFGYLNLGSQMWRLFYTLYKQHGAEIVLTPGQPMQADRDAAIESLEFMASLFDDTIAAKSGDINTGIAEFVRGDSGMLFSGGWEMPTMKKAKLPVDAVTIPTLYGTPAAYADSHSFVLPRQLVADEQSRRDAYKFVSDVLKGSLSWAEAGHIPAYQPIVQSQAYRELSPQAHYANAADIIAYDPEAWFSGSGSDWQTYFSEYIQNVLLGRNKAAAGWDGFVARTNDLLFRPNPV